MATNGSPPGPPATISPERRTLARRVVRLLFLLGRLAALVYLGVMAVLYALQTRMIFAGSTSQGTPESVVGPRPGRELVTLRSARGEAIVALFGPALTPDGMPRTDAARRPTLLYFYGNGMYLKAAEYEFERFRRLGLNVMIPEYLGYGMSQGQPGEASCYATADAAYDHLRSRRDIDPERIVAAGWSLGGAVAIDLAARREVAGLAVFSTFTSMADMARRTFPYMPTSLLLRHRFDSVSKIAMVSCPVLIGHGTDDSIVPFAMSDRLATMARVPVDRVSIAGADHNDVFEVQPEETFERLRRFVERVTAP
jgi:fermentation-respiration switch protein FrsA (DUF1100 family)